MTILTPDNFKRNWYGWITNQWSHVVLGQMLFGLLMISTLYCLDEFGSRACVWFMVALLYAAWEILTYKPGKVWDAIEDFCFVVVYGAGWLAAAFHEITPGQDGFLGNLSAIMPIIGLFAFHTTLGVFFRLERRAKT